MEYLSNAVRGPPLPQMLAALQADVAELQSQLQSQLQQLVRGGEARCRAVEDALRRLEDALTGESDDALVQAKDAAKVCVQQVCTIRGVLNSLQSLYTYCSNH